MAYAFIQNIALIVAAAVLYHFARRRMGSLPQLASLLNGFLFGLAAILAMSTPFRFTPGVIYDGRSIILGVAALFGGAVVASLAGLIALTYRIFFIGGPGSLAGSISIVESVAVGLFFYFRRRKLRRSYSKGELLIAAFVIHFGLLAAQLALPQRQWVEVIPQIALPMLTLYPFGFYLVCALFVEDEERVEARRALEASEARYRSLFMNRHTVMLLMDQSGRILDANLAAADFYGWSRERLVGMNIVDISELSLPEIRKRWKLAEEMPNTRFEHRHKLASGEMREVEVFSGPIEYQGQKAFYSIVHDATARLAAEREVRELNRTLEQRVERRTKELEDANQELEAFSYSVSHDLRAPLRAILGFTDMLAEESGGHLGPSLAPHLEGIRRNALKMGRLIDDLLRLSRIGRQNIDRVRVDLSALAENLVSELRAKAPDRLVELDIEAGLWTLADKALSEVLLENLLSNAWKFTARATAARISFSASGLAGEQVFSVKDNGVGFDMRYADKLFAPFQRLHAEKDYEGSGIGLSIVRRIVERHGGRIWVEAEPDKGATFSFTFGEQA